MGLHPDKIQKLLAEIDRLEKEFKDIRLTAKTLHNAYVQWHDRITMIGVTGIEPTKEEAEHIRNQAVESHAAYIDYMLTAVGRSKKLCKDIEAVRDQLDRI